MKKVLLFILCLSSLSLGHYAVISRPLRSLNLDKIKNDLRLEEAQKQEKLFPSAIKAEEAVALALVSFLNDSSHIESPLALAGTEEALFSHLNEYSSEITFLLVGEEAEHGEQVNQNWVIQLKIPTLSDHIFFAVVKRDGSRCPYNYGFN